MFKGQARAGLNRLISKHRGGGVLVCGNIVCGRRAIARVEHNVELFLRLGSKPKVGLGVMVIEGLHDNVVRACLDVDIERTSGVIVAVVQEVDALKLQLEAAVGLRRDRDSNRDHTQQQRSSCRSKTHAGRAVSRCTHRCRKGHFGYSLGIPPTQLSLLRQAH